MGRDKATLTMPGLIGNRRLVEHVVDVVARRCVPVFVIAAPGQSLPELPAEIVRDAVPGAGPLAATGLGLHAAARAGRDHAFVCAVDMPLLATELIDALLAASVGSNSEVTLPHDGRDHYLAALYRTAVAARIDTLVAAGEHSMRGLIETLAVQRIEPADPTMLANVNTPAELRAVHRER